MSREERVLSPSRARTHWVAAQAGRQREKVEGVKSDLTDDQHLSADGTTDVVPHDANSKLEALKVGGNSDPAKER